MRIWFDTEFIDDGKTVELLSIGMVAEDGREYYAEAAETDRSRACPWVQENVIPHLTGPVRTRGEIAEGVRAFVGPKPEFWAWFAAYDWVVLCQLYGRMIELPRDWPMYCNDLVQMVNQSGGAQLPEHTGTKHNALDDARWTKQAWDSAQAIYTLRLMHLAR